MPGSFFFSEEWDTKLTCPKSAVAVKKVAGGGVLSRGPALVREADLIVISAGARSGRVLESPSPLDSLRASRATVMSM